MSEQPKDNTGQPEDAAKAALKNAEDYWNVYEKRNKTHESKILAPESLAFTSLENFEVGKEKELMEILREAINMTKLSLDRVKLVIIISKKIENLIKIENDESKKNALMSLQRTFLNENII